VEIAEAHEVTPAQVVIRWHLEHEIVVIPKSANADRIAENADVFGFALTEDEVATLDDLGSGARRD
jgi:diketogulonate reductase-like aldo/keto reductase